MYFIEFLCYNLSVKVAHRVNKEKAMKPKHIKELQEKAKDLRAMRVNKNTIVVESTSNTAANHIVTVEYDSEGTIHARCTCPWAINGGVACTHVIAALETLAAVRGRRLSFWADESEAHRQKRKTFYLRGAKAREEDGVWITSRPTAA
jgi:hypothetical protein